MAEASGFDRVRGPLSAGLAVLAVVAALAGGVALYVQEEVVSSDAFADRAVAALENPDVRRVVSREIVVGLIDRGSTDLISARPVVESVVQFVVASEPFRRVFRLAALNGHKLLFVRDARNVAFDIADAGTAPRAETEAKIEHRRCDDEDKAEPDREIEAKYEIDIKRADGLADNRQPAQQNKRLDA